MHEESKEYFRQPAGITWLWVGVLAGPVAVALQQQLLYLLVTLKCSYSKATVLLPVVLFTLAIAAFGLWISWRNWRQAGGEAEDESGDVNSRSRFMGIWGLLFNTLSLLTIIAISLPPFFYNQCQR